MATVQHNLKLNQLLIALDRSLLQYAGHCSTWSSRKDAAIAEEFPTLVATQREHVSELTELLTERHWTIDFGGFPMRFTDLHFLSLQFLLKSIVINQHAILSELEEASHTSIDDPEAATLIEQLLSGERQLTERIEELARSAGKATV